MNPKLIITYENGDQEELELSADMPIFIGRDAQCDIVVPERKVSRQHARLLYLPTENRVFIEDLNSLNGTRVNDTKIPAPQDLNHGDIIKAGSAVMQFQWDKPASSAARISGFARTTDMSDAQSAELAYDYFSADEESQGGSTDGRMIAGKIEDLPLTDVLQMLATTRKSGELVVSTKRIGRKKESAVQGVVYMNAGQVHFVEYAGKTNEKAFYHLLRLKKGFFALFPLKRKDFPSTMETPLEALLLEGLRILDEEEAEPPFTNETALNANPDEPLTGLKPDELRIFQLAWRLKKIGLIMEQTPFGKTETEAILQKLLRNGFLSRED